MNLNTGVGHDGERIDELINRIETENGANKQVIDEINKILLPMRGRSQRTVSELRIYVGQVAA